MHILWSYLSSAQPYAFTLRHYYETESTLWRRFKQNYAPKNKVTELKEPQNEKNHSNINVIYYRSMSGANIRMCIVTEYNRIFSVW